MISGDEALYWDNIISQWEAIHPNIHVEFETVAWDEVITKETAAFAAGEAPDITFQTENFPVYAKRGYLLSLEDYLPEGKKDGYTESALNYCSNDGQLMGIPFIALNSVMFYNKTIFEEAGVDLWNENRTNIGFYNGQVAMTPNQIQNGNTIRNNSDVDLGAFLIPAGPAEDSEHSAEAAASVISFIPLFIAFMCAKDQFIEGMTIGAVKG